MDYSAIIAAAISAVASIIVAIVGRPRPSPSESGRRVITYSFPERHARIWAVAVAMLVAWMVLAPLFVHWDLAAVSILIVPLALWILAAAVPISPSVPPALALLLLPLAFLSEPIAKWRHGVSTVNHFEPAALGILLAVAFGSAAIAWLLARWRASAYRSATTSGQAPEAPAAWTKDLAELARLHRSGELSDDEFARAKDKLLSK